MELIRKRQRVELDGRVYCVTWIDDTRTRAFVRVQTKTGWRTLNGHGRANRGLEQARVIMKALEEASNAT